MRRCLLALIPMFASSLFLCAQTHTNDWTSPANDPSASSSVPLVVSFPGQLSELDGAITTGTRSLTFALYAEQNGGPSLWSESQIVQLDSHGHFAVLLGSASTAGMPAGTFEGGEPRWIGITPDDGVERSRVELTSVPYAFKAADADTLGGKRSDQFVSQEQLGNLLYILRLPGPVAGPPSWASQAARAPSFEATATVGPSFISNTAAGPPFQVSSESLIPHLNVDLLHGLSDSAFAKVQESNLFQQLQLFQGGIDLPATTLEANTQQTFDSAPFDFESSSLNPQTNAQTNQRFRWIAQPLFSATGGPAARLALLFGANGLTPSSTGLSINSDGTINFAPGQRLPSGAVEAALSNSGDGGSGPGSGGPIVPIVETSNYPWTEKLLNAPIQVGSNSITLTPCPKGVNGTNLWHNLYISGTGTPEVVLITGGSCVSRAASGTIEFNAIYAHPVGYLIGTASDGIQEAFYDAGVLKSAGQISRQVQITPGAHLLRARVSIRSSSMTVTSTGAVLTCMMSDTCIMVGDPTSAGLFSGISLQGLRLAAGVVNGTWPAIEDNAQGTIVANFGPATSAVQGATFGYLVQIDNDQAATIDGLTSVTNIQWGRCDTTFCSTAIYGPGPFSTNAGVIWVKNANLSLQCNGNGIDNKNGNTLDVTNSVIQGWGQFGIRANTTFQAKTVNLTGVREEEDGNCNPFGTGSAGLIVEGGEADVSGSQISGFLPVFSNVGTLQYFYYVVVHSSTLGTSPIYLAGKAVTDGTTKIPVVWNRIGTEGNITYDVLRISGDGSANMKAPFGTGPFAVATGVPATSCSTATCSLVDDPSVPGSAYAVSDATWYWPALKMWPGTIILTSSFDRQNTGGGNPTTLVTDSIPSEIIINSAGGTYPSVFAQECNPQGPWSPILEVCQAGNSVGNDFPPVTGTVLQLTSSQSSPGGLKGRTIYALPSGGETAPLHIITLLDSNADKTMATPNNRPDWDATDSFIGIDGGYNPNTIGISFGAPVSLTRYIGTVGDGTEYKERLTATQEEYRVPVGLQPVIFIALTESPNGSLVYCSDCMNVADDGALFDSVAVVGGHGTSLLRENGQWRVH